MTHLRLILLSLFLWLPMAAAADTYLLMAEENGCYWCGKWNEEIADIYPRTAEGQAAPLRRFDLHGEDPEVTFKRRVHFTPTFILVRDGTELDRIEGYPGADFFWGLLAKMLEGSDIPVERNG